ncbi:MAG TPA: serine hydrolase, partial [Bacillota bacterium]|nr:serine hydrolase [Bacillota bacterium]
MSIYTWIGLIGATIATFFPLLTRKKLQKDERIAVIRNSFILIGVLVSVFILQINSFIVIVAALIAAVVLDKKTYTKKRLLIYGGIFVGVVALFLFIFRTNPNYVTKHMLKHPETTSLYIAIDGEPVISHESDVVRPLASVVKIVVALEYAYQVSEGTIDENTEVLVEDLDKYYIKDTDGGAHPDWKEEEGLEDAETVSLKEVARGMITYSSNANTEYLIDLLGAETINQRMKTENIEPHDEVYPIVSGLLVVAEEKRTSEDKDWLEKFSTMDVTEYGNRAFEIHEQLKEGTYDTSGVDHLSLKEQRVWSDHLTGSTAEAYGELLHRFVTEDFDEEVNTIMHDLLRYGLESNPKNREYYEAIGTKGGSTAFIINQAMFIEMLDGTQYEFVILTD